MSAPSLDPASVQFKIVSQTFDTWNVQFRVDLSELVDHKSLLRHLRAIKQKIAEKQRLHANCMIFDGTVSKTRTNEYVDVVVRIKKVAFEKGNPSVTFKEGVALDGTHYAHMTALLDVCYLDRFERIITLPRVMQTICESGVPAESFEHDLIAQKVQEVLNKQAPLKGISFANGRFPDIGRDAEIEFYLPASPEPGHSDAYYSSRRVKSGDVLCRKRPCMIGENAGMNVIGETLPPRSGMDIALTAETGAALSADGNEVTADSDGVVVITRTRQTVSRTQCTKEFPQSVSLKVNPELKVQGNQVLDIASSQTVEVVGNLSMGSRILTDCEVFVSGDVEAGTLIQAADDITVEGEVRGAELSSQSNVVLQKDVSDSSVVSARGGIQIRGKAIRSKLVGNTVTAESAAGCSILARQKVTLGRVESDEKGILSTICVGMADFFRQRLADNREFLQKARENLKQIETLMGRDLVDEVTSTNVQSILMRFLAKSHAAQDANRRRQIDLFRKLLESVPPSKSLIAQREQENADLAQRIAEQTGQTGGVVIVREQIASATTVHVDGAEANLPPTDGSVAIRADGKGGLLVEPETAHT